MSTINLYTINKADVLSCLHSNYSYMFHDYINYFKMISKKQSPETQYTEAQYTEMAEEWIYNKCVQNFRYSEYVTSAKDALDCVYRGDYKRIQEFMEKEERRIKKEEKRIALLRKKCAEKGLDFEIENKKELKRISRAAGRRCIILTSVSLILALICTLLGMIFESFRGVYTYFILLSVFFPVIYIVKKVRYIVKKVIKYFFG